MAEIDGAAIFGIWILILEACSQQSNRAGWLTDGGESGGSPWLASDLSLKFKRPEKEISRALQILCSDRIGWILAHDADSHHEVTTKSPRTDTEGRKEGIEEKEGRNASLAVSSEVFGSWNTLAQKHDLPQCLVLSDKRRRSLSARLDGEFFRSNWKAAMERIKSSVFCLGKNERGWKANFDWFIQPDSVARIMEGKYSGVSAPKPIVSQCADATYDASKDAQ